MDTHQQYRDQLDRHYAGIWGQSKALHVWSRGPALPQSCRVFEYAPSGAASCWVYATCGMTLRAKSPWLELFLLSPRQTDEHVELLTAIAHYHQTGATLGLGHTMNFGRPWLDKSSCSFGLISLPYLFGPALEDARIDGGTVRVLWLLPITPEERAFKVASGLDALEELFEKQNFDYLDPTRPSVVRGSCPES